MADPRGDKPSPDGVRRRAVRDSSPLLQKTQSFKESTRKDDDSSRSTDKEGEVTAREDGLEQKVINLDDLMKPDPADVKRHNDKVNVGDPLLERNVFNQEQFDKKHGFKRVNLSLGRRLGYQFTIMRSWGWFEWARFVRSRVPIFGWLPKYAWREGLMVDVIGGIMISIMTVPQSLAYAYLVGVPPIYGLITCIFGPLIYVIFGTCMHTSPGSFAIVSLMIGSTVDAMGKQALEEAGGVANVTTNASLVYPDFDPDTQICCKEVSDKLDPETAVDIAMAISFYVGIWQIIFGIVNAGVLAVWLSDHLVQGLTSGAAIHVMSSQLKAMTGIYDLPPTSEVFGLIKFYICFVEQVLDGAIKWDTLICSTVCTLLLICSSYYIDPILKKWTPIKFPMELLLVIACATVNFLSQGTRYQLNLPHVGHVESGLKPPRMPPIDKYGSAFMGSVSIAVISFVIHIALAKLVSKKLHYQIDVNQEWFALGLMHSISSIFGCFAGGSSLGRTMMLVKFGTKSQLSTFVCVLILLGIIHGGSSLIYHLPKAVLATIVVIAMKDMYIQVFRSARLIHVSVTDFLIWLVSFSAVMLLNVNYGLIIGVCFALLTVVFKTQWAESCCMGRIAGTSDFKGLRHYRTAEEVPGFKVFRLDAPLYFANAEMFISRVHEATGLNPMLVKAAFDEQKRREKAKEREKSKREKDPEVKPLLDDKPQEIVMHRNRVRTPQQDEVTDASVQLTHIIIDCSSMPYIDLMGKEAMEATASEYGSIDIVVLFACCKVGVRQMLEETDFHQKVPKSRFFVSLADAVAHAQKEQLQAKAVHAPIAQSLTAVRAAPLPMAKSPMQKTVIIQEDTNNTAAVEHLVSAVSIDGQEEKKKEKTKEEHQKKPSNAKPAKTVHKRGLKNFISRENEKNEKENEDYTQ